MPYKARDIEKVYWTIGEAAEIADEYTSALRFWGEECPWTKPKYNRRGNRAYDRDSLSKILKVAYLSHTCGVSIDPLRHAHENGYIEDLIDFYLLPERNLPCTFEEYF